MPNRQANAAFAADLIALKAKAAALGFRSHQDALDFVARGLEESRRRIASLNLNSVDRYRGSDVDIFLGIRSRRSGKQCDLVFSKIPADTGSARTDDFFDLMTGLNSDGEECVWLGEKQPLQSKMLIGISNLVRGQRGSFPPL